MTTAASTTSHQLGTVRRIDDRTVLVLGQELDVTRHQPHANALLHRVGETLFLIDTGLTATIPWTLRGLRRPT